MKNYLFLKNYVTSEEAISHNVLYYQKCPVPLTIQTWLCVHFQTAYYTNTNAKSFRKQKKQHKFNDWTKSFTAGQWIHVNVLQLTL